MQNEQNTLTKPIVQATTERIESLAEAIANASTHGLGALLSIAAFVILLVVATTHDDMLKIISSIFYGSSLIMMYASSTLYHSLPYPKLKRYFRMLDHTSIYLLIAGTYTPFTLVTMDGVWGWTMFGIIWGLAIFGITFKLIFKHRYEIMSLFIYLLMGWICVIAIKPLWQALPMPGLIWLLLGGLAYTGGITFYVWEKLPFSHTIWHLFVLIGSTCHFIAVLFYVIL